MRIAVVREFHNNGISDPYDLAMLFHNQPDFDLDYSIKMVESIIKDDYGVWSWDTLVDRCGGFVEAFNSSLLVSGDASGNNVYV